MCPVAHITEIVESPLESVLPTFLTVKASAKPKEVTARDKTLLEMKRDIDLLRMELRRGVHGGREMISSEAEADSLLHRYLDAGMPAAAVEANLVERGVPRGWVRNRLERLMLKRRKVVRKSRLKGSRPTRR